MKRLTILERTVLDRKQKGYFSERKEIVKLVDSTDKKIEKELDELNKGKISRFFKKKVDFNLKTKKGTIDCIHWLIDNHEEYNESNILKELIKSITEKKWGK